MAIRGNIQTVRSEASPASRPNPAPKPFLLPGVPARAHDLSPGASLLLDATRLTAALMVVAAHLGHPEFATGLPIRQLLGDIAVPVFFVLSGFVIRYVTLARAHTLRQFAIDRAARIYSVALPAMLLTLLLAGVCSRLAPAYYGVYFGGVSDHPLARILLNLTFLSQSWGHNTIPFIDSPFWSLSYECLYYAGYGLFFYLRGWKRVASLLVWAVIAGPQVLFLLPIWYAGCAVYDLYAALRRNPLAASVIRVAFACLAGCLILGAAAGGDSFARLLDVWFAIPNPLSLLGVPPMRATMLAIGAGSAAAVALLVSLAMVDAVPVRAKSLWARRFRSVADGTFAIYLMHYPLMVLATTLGLLRPHHALGNLATAAAICLLLIAAAAPLDAFKDRIRSWLRVRSPIAVTGKPEPAPT